MARMDSIPKPGQPEGFGGHLRKLNSWGPHRAGAKLMKFDLGMTGGTGGLVGRLMGPAFLAYSAYAGYQEGGLGGAISGTASHLATTYAMGMGLNLVGGASGAAAIAGGTLGAMSMMGAAKMGANPFSLSTYTRGYTSEHRKQHRSLEMGSPVVDQFGTSATMRQRSLNALMNSRINGRTAFGNEGALMYRPYFR